MPPPYWIIKLWTSILARKYNILRLTIPFAMPSARKRGARQCDTEQEGAVQAVTKARRAFSSKCEHYADVQWNVISQLGSENSQQLQCYYDWLEYRGTCGHTGYLLEQFIIWVVFSKPSELLFLEQLGILIRVQLLFDNRYFGLRKKRFWQLFYLIY